MTGTLMLGRSYEAFPDSEQRRAERAAALRVVQRHCADDLATQFDVAGMLGLIDTSEPAPVKEHLAIEVEGVTLPPAWSPRTGQCATDECERPVSARGLCDMHYARARRKLRASAGTA